MLSILMMISATAIAQKASELDSSSSKPWLYYDQGHGFAVAIPDFWNQRNGTWYPKDTNIQNAYITVDKISGQGTKDLREHFQWLRTSKVFSEIDSSNLTGSVGEVWGRIGNGISYLREISTPFGLYQIIIDVPQGFENSIKSIIPKLVGSFRAVATRSQPGC
ncbi:MAG TPA: hypothetical protein VGM92_14100 [Candidatus Kapabacteria bacterium]